MKEEGVELDDEDEDNDDEEIRRLEVSIRWIADNCCFVVNGASVQC